MLARKHWHPSLTDEVIRDAVGRRIFTLDNPGFCILCGTEQSAEPDATNYRCEGCGARQVFGAETLLFEIGW